MAQELKDYDIMDIEAMDDERLEKSSSGKIFVTRVYIKEEVDAVLAEKDKEIRKLNNALDKERSETIKYMDELCNAKNEIERLTIDKRNNELRADVADATVEKLKAEIAELKESQRWRKCSEEMPTAKDANESGKLLGYLGGFKIAHEYHWTDVRDKLYGITHWMPLPKALELAEKFKEGV